MDGWGGEKTHKKTEFVPTWFENPSWVIRSQVDSSAHLCSHLALTRVSSDHSKPALTQTFPPVMTKCLVVFVNLWEATMHFTQFFATRFIFWNHGESHPHSDLFFPSFPVKLVDLNYKLTTSQAVILDPVINCCFCFMCLYCCIQLFSTPLHATFAKICIWDSVVPKQVCDKAVLAVKYDSGQMLMQTST